MSNNQEYPREVLFYADNGMGWEDCSCSLIEDAPCNISSKTAIDIVSTLATVILNSAKHQIKNCDPEYLGSFFRGF